MTSPLKIVLDLLLLRIIKALSLIFSIAGLMVCVRLAGSQGREQVLLADFDIGEHLVS